MTIEEMIKRFGELADASYEQAKAEGTAMMKALGADGAWERTPEAERLLNAPEVQRYAEVHGERLVEEYSAAIKGN